MNDDELPMRVVRAANLAALDVAEHEWDVFAQLRDVKEFLTKDQKPYLVLELADVHAVIDAKVWDNSPEAMAAAKAAQRGSPVKVRGRFKERPGYAAQLVVEKLKVIDPAQAPEGSDMDQLVDPALAPVEDLCCRTLVFDIETVPAFDRKDLPHDVAESLIGYTSRKFAEPDVVEAESKKFMGMSPFFGKVVSLMSEERPEIVALPVFLSRVFRHLEPYRFNQAGGGHARGRHRSWSPVRSTRPCSVSTPSMKSTNGSNFGSTRRRRESSARPSGKRCSNGTSSPLACRSSRWASAGSRRSSACSSA